MNIEVPCDVRPALTCALEEDRACFTLGDIEAPQDADDLNESADLAGGFLSQLGNGNTLELRSDRSRAWLRAFLTSRAEAALQQGSWRELRLVASLLEAVPSGAMANG